jgi:hypothetical protein
MARLLREFAELASGGGIRFLNEQGEEVEAEYGRLDGGWTVFRPDGSLEVGEFWQDGSGPLESVTSITYPQASD